MIHTIENDQEIEVNAEIDGEFHQIPENGELGMLNDIDSLTLIIDVPDENNILVVDVERRGDDRVPVPGTFRDCNLFKRYKQEVQLGTAEGNPYTKYPSNCRRVMQMHQDGRISIWQVSIFAQDGRFKTVVQPAYMLHAARNGRGIALGGDRLSWEKSELKRIISEMMHTAHFPAEIPEDAGSPKLDVPSDPHTGVVAWYNHGRQTGAIRTADGTLKVHWSQVLPREDGFKHLTRGEEVEFETGPAHRSSNFDRQALGVKVVD